MGGATARFGVTRATSATARRAVWIATARGNTRLHHLAQNPPSFLARRFWFRSADRVCVPSPALAANLFAMDASLTNKVMVVPNVIVPFPCDVAEARARVDALVGGSARRPVVGCLGSFQEERNYPLLADALPLVLRSRPDAHFLIVGRTIGTWYGADAARFRTRIEALGLDDHVTMAGDIANGRTLLPGLDVFALPSKLEGSSNALAEAMFAGVATATVPVSDAEELVGDAAVVSRGWTPSAFAEAILAALEEGPALRERAAARGRVLAVERCLKKLWLPRNCGPSENARRKAPASKFHAEIES